MRRQISRPYRLTATQGRLVRGDIGCLTRRAGVENRALETGKGGQERHALVDVEIGGWLLVGAIGKGKEVYETFWDVD